MKTKNDRQKIGKWLKWLIPILLFLLPVILAGIYQTVDLLGVKQLPQAETLTRWMLGLLTLWLTSQGLSAIFFERPGQRVEDLMDERFEKIGEEIKKEDAALGQILLERTEPQKAVFEATRDYEKPIGLIKKAPPSSWIYLTDLASGGETDPVVAQYANIRDERILQDDCNFRKIVAIYSREGLNELKRHLEKCSRTKNYELRVFKGRCLIGKTDKDREPRFDAIILAPSEAVFGLTRSGDIVAQYAGALRVNDKDIAGILLSWFNSLWVISCPLKTQQGIDETFLKELELQLSEQLGKEEILHVTTYRKRSSSYDSMLKALDNARESIDIVSFVNLTAADDLRNQYFTSLRRAIEERHVSHQRIIWNLDHILWIEKMFDNGWDELPEVCIKFHHLPALSKMPLTTFDLVDQHTVFLGQGWLTEGHIAINDADAGEYFRGYFSVLWEQAEWIKKRGQPADRARLKALADELSR